jgi:thiol-disulfide isomerase/thioredoxin
VIGRGVIVIVAAAFAAGAGFYAYQQRSARVAVVPPTAPAPTPAKLVATVPAFSLADRDGHMRTLADWQGKALIVNFWATWCAPCRKEIPLLQKLQREHGDEGFQVVGIAVDFRDKVLAYADEMKIEYPLLIGEQEALDAAASFGIEAVGFPFTIFTDNRGRVVAAHMGELTQPQADLILSAVRDVGAGRQTLEQARSVIESGLAALPPA